MSKWGRLPILLLGLLPSCATPSDNFAEYDPAFDLKKPFALISGSVGTQRVRGFPACPADSICIDAVFEIELENAEMVAGTARSPIRTVWTVWHTGVDDSPRMAFIVQKANDGRLWSRGRGASVLDGKACFADWAWEDHRELFEDAGGELVGDSVCVRVR